ncbi:MAG: hypothetical protein CL844_03695 [Crocinitomicaceae bacterium]|nr:hypothetical protein [Crocinitomicaceae bacterium]
MRPPRSPSSSCCPSSRDECLRRPHDQPAPQARAAGQKAVVHGQPARHARPQARASARAAAAALPLGVHPAAVVDRGAARAGHRRRHDDRGGADALRRLLAEAAVPQDPRARQPRVRGGRRLDARPGAPAAAAQWAGARARPKGAGPAPPRRHRRRVRGHGGRARRGGGAPWRDPRGVHGGGRHPPGSPHDARALCGPHVVPRQRLAARAPGQRLRAVQRARAHRHARQRLLLPRRPGHARRVRAVQAEGVRGPHALLRAAEQGDGQGAHRAGGDGGEQLRARAAEQAGRAREAHALKARHAHAAGEARQARAPARHDERDVHVLLERHPPHEHGAVAHRAVARAAQGPAAGQDVRRAHGRARQPGGAPRGARARHAAARASRARRGAADRAAQAVEQVPRRALQGDVRRGRGDLCGVGAGPRPVLGRARVRGALGVPVARRPAAARVARADVQAVGHGRGQARRGGAARRLRRARGPQDL